MIVGNCGSTDCSQLVPSNSASGAPNFNFRKTCSEDSMRSRIFGTDLF